MILHFIFWSWALAWLYVPCVAAQEQPPPATPLPTPPAETSVAGAVEINVRAASAKERMEASTESVQVVDLATERRESAELSEVLARTSGVGVRRTGGLGSDMEISLGGLSGDQVRVFIDGLPLEFAGFGSGIGNLPIGLLQRVEIYRGVVPIRFGANALGGALNVVTRQPTRGSGGSASLEYGSFGTTRVTGSAHHVAADGHLVIRANGFLDDAKNNYPIQVDLDQLDGSTRRATVYRKHGAYRAFGGGAELGVVRTRWAERLLLKVFASKRDNQVQNNVSQTVPYGEVTYGGENYGTSLSYVQPLRENLKVELLLGYGFRTLDFYDNGQYRYDWYGQRTRLLPRRGENGFQAYDQTLGEHGAFARAQLEWQLSRAHALRFNLSPSLVRRSGVDHTRMPGSIDWLSATQRQTILVSALEHGLELFDGRLQNQLFGKSYLYFTEAREPTFGTNWRERGTSSHRFGVGDGLRVQVWGPLSVKAAYELATRLPDSDELFGNGGQKKPNLGLKPEVSHNNNLSVLLERTDSSLGSFSAQLHGFIRRTKNQVVPLGDGTFISYYNLYAATSRGVEAIGHWRSPGKYAELDANATYQAFRNQTDSGSFGQFKGDRIPNQPYFFANASARATWPKPFGRFDELTLGYYLRYVHAFYRGWESAGRAGEKYVIPKQVSHTLVLTYLLRSAQRGLSLSFEAQNIANAALFDNFGVQRPGRGYYGKAAADF